MKGHSTMKILFETRNWDVEVEIFKTCSCPLIQYLGALFWYDITIFWDEN